MQSGAWSASLMVIPLMVSDESSSLCAAPLTLEITEKDARKIVNRRGALSKER